MSARAADALPDSSARRRDSQGGSSQSRRHAGGSSRADGDGDWRRLPAAAVAADASSEALVAESPPVQREGSRMHRRRAQQDSQQWDSAAWDDRSWRESSQSWWAGTGSSSWSTSGWEADDWKASASSSRGSRAANGPRDLDLGDKGHPSSSSSSRRQGGKGGKGAGRSERGDGGRKGGKRGGESVEANSSAAAAVEDAENDAGEWTCGACTLINPTDSACCAACETPNPGRPSKGAGKGRRGKAGGGSGAKGKKQPSRSAASAAQLVDSEGEGDLLPETLGDTVSERLAAQLSAGRYECMICLGQVARKAAIWSCDQCWAAFDLSCIREWVETSGARSVSQFAWQCPGCRYERVGPLPDYRCYCGQVLQPELNPHWLPHSCGSVCDRRRPGCPHPCAQLCHPGPCQPCASLGPAGGCHCGREVKDATRCGEPTAWSCRNTCGKELSCGSHRCPLICHAGPCPPCAVAVQSSCFCGAVQDERRLCGQEAFSCRGICSKILGCGVHSCERLCHEGDCGTCPREPATWGDRCACGQVQSCSSRADGALLSLPSAPRKSCGDPLPLCRGSCSRSHPGCGHTCGQPCHDGACGPCERKCKRACRCGRSSLEVPCMEREEVCCPGANHRQHEDHLCLEVCGKALACGEHVCEEFCHLGKCPPCRVVLPVPLSCACGARVASGVSRCGTQPPYCDEPCQGTLDCGHSCRARCHTGPHPLCCELVSKVCFGGHRMLPPRHCHLAAISCGETCKKALPCGHDCAATCHTGDCPPCSNACGKPRGCCEHPCEAACHPEAPCPDEPCRRKVRQSCACGLRLENKLCGAYSKAASKASAQASIKCAGICDRSTRSSGAPPSTGGARAGDAAVQFASDLVKIAADHRKFVQVLEDHFWAIYCSVKAADAPPPQPLPALDSLRCFLAVEYARLYWRLQAKISADATMDGWWLLRLQPTPIITRAGREGHDLPPPYPLLSQLLGASAMTAGLSTAQRPSLGSQPRLRFSGFDAGKSFGEDVYDLVGIDAEGFLGVRRGDHGEVLAYFQRGAAALAVVRRLTGEPSAQTGQALPVVTALPAADRGAAIAASAAVASSSSRGGWGSIATGVGPAAAAARATDGVRGLTVTLEQTLGSNAVGRPTASAALARRERHAAEAAAAAAAAAAQQQQEQEEEAAHPAEDDP
eukprot:TRINITY_DN17398_c0_g1_i2.p1 TRINITY_DN17398_c0_g1~~TRINITY_DN17398_c0_g1_i2.p1  ORF type:complete len:1170 (-),score=215.73 TRINITY_DN17398_c0_g1_i2:85-3594(-)